MPAYRATIVYWHGKMEKENRGADLEAATGS